jgi:hypothetical protein
MKFVVALRFVIVLFVLIISATGFGQHSQLIDSLPGDIRVVVAGKQYQRGRIHTFLFGRHYRKEWATGVKVPTIDLGKVHGGLKLLQEGGGRQTKTLRFEAPNGKQYVLRSIDKSYKGAIEDILEGTFIETIANDQVSVAHPYAAFTVPSLAEHAGVYHTNPQLVFLPESKLLGELNAKYANRVFLFEERPDGDQSDAPFFGNAKDVIGTDDMMKLVSENNDHKVDQLAYVRARLFDMFLGDWGRHEDQWRWGVFKENGFTIYRAIPRDRDQTYTLFDGLLVGPVAGSSAAGYLESFDYHIKDVQKFNHQARFMDRKFANEPSLDVWVRIATELQTALTDTAIEAAVRRMPPETYTISGSEIVAKLKSRRNDLIKIATEYFYSLANEVEFAGTPQQELFEVNKASASETKVNVFRLEGEKKQLIYSRTFNVDETKEIRLYGINGTDKYVVYGNSTNRTAIRLIGGPAVDSFIDQSGREAGKRVLVYDNHANSFTSQHRFRTNYSSDTSIHRYEYKNFRYSSKGITTGISFNNDDELHVSLGYQITTQKWRKQPFGSKHHIRANYSVTQNSFSAQYRSIFTELIGKTDLVLFANWDQDRNYHFPGIGNNTTIIADPQDFYRTRFHELNASVGGVRRIGKTHTISMTGFYHSIRLIKDPGKFMTQTFAPVTASMFERQNFAGVQVGYAFEKMNHPMFPTRGIKFTTDGAYTMNLEVDDRSFARYSGLLGFYVPLIKSVALAVKTQASTIDGDAEFYQMPRLGGGSSLRGFLRHRFFGKTAFSNQNELQWIFNFRSYLFNGKIGLIGIFDNGRVWIPGESSEKWHMGFGAGLMIAPFNKFQATVGYTRSDEIGRFNIRIGRFF